MSQVEPLPTMKTIGIIGGASDVATVEYYKALNAITRRHLGGNNNCEMVLANMNWAQVVRIVENELWDTEGAAYLHDKAERLHGARADFIICVANTMHRMADGFMKGIRIPLLHIIDPTALAIRERGLKKVLLLGTKPTMAAMFQRERYRQTWGIECVVPKEEDQDYVSKVIFEEFARQVFTAEAKIRYLEIVEKSKGEGTQGLIMGCTEIPLLISQKDMPDFPFFDVMQLHAEAAVKIALDERPAEKSIPAIFEPKD